MANIEFQSPTLTYHVGAPNVTMVGVRPLTPETFDLDLATESAERLEAVSSKRAYRENIEDLVECARQTSEGEL